MLKVIQPGFYTSIQDAGRFKYRHLGVPTAGAMDAKAMQKANLLLQNPKNAAVLEVTMTGLEVVFEAPTFISIAGANLSPTLNQNAIANYQIYKVAKGDTLAFGKLIDGFRAYVAVKDGFLTPEVLGSKSQYQPLTNNAKLQLGQSIAYNTNKNFDPLVLEVKPAAFMQQKELEVYKGPEFEMLEDKQIDTLLNQPFTIAKENNRMAYQLEELLPNNLPTMLTSATLPGTVQLTPQGKLIILMRDGQTTGGYPRVLQLSEAAICVLAQKRMGNQIKFQLVYLN